MPRPGSCVELGSSKRFAPWGSSPARRATERVRDDWAAIGAVEVDHRLADEAATLALAHDLRSLDALHLAAALLLPPDDLLMATWDRRLQAAAAGARLRVLPEALA